MNGEFCRGDLSVGEEFILCLLPVLFISRIVFHELVSNSIGCKIDHRTLVADSVFDRTARKLVLAAELTLVLNKNFLRERTFARPFVDGGCFSGPCLRRPGN